MTESEYIDKTRNIPTPALVIDGAAVRRNIERLAGYAAHVGLEVRPHTKTHKLRSLARMQLDAGAIGLTAAKVSEAAAISDAEQDVLLAYPPIGPERARRLAELARDRTVRAVVDSMTGIEMISEAASSQKTTVGLLVELDVGMGRMGVPTPEATLPLAQAIDCAPHVHLDGIMVYPGHIWEKVEQQEAPLAAVNELLAETIALWAKQGLAATIVSGGSTPTAYQSHVVMHLTEIRPGTYVFNDMNTVHGGFCTMEDCAARVHATVISDAVLGQVVIDAGSKTLSSDRCLPAMESGFGRIVELDGARITRLSEEHGQVDVRECPSPPRVGERLTVIPNHICPCLNLQESVWWVESNERPRQFPVDARGKIQ
jgi:D-serine deaminase-like pyridoxal phosphate-dependent protein